MVITGDIGCGKTTLCRRLLPMLPARSFLSLVLNPFLTADDLLRQVLEDFGLVSPEDLKRGPLTRASCHELARALHHFLNSLEQIDGSAIVIIDEAQNLPLKTLEQIRLLSNFETNHRKLLQIILVGQKELEPILELPELRQLKQRVSRRCRIEPLRRSELAAYINHRLEAAMPPGEAPQVKFTAGAVRAISGLSHGVPRLVNLLCDRALEIGCAQGAIVIDRRLALSAAEDLELAIPSTLRLEPATRLAVAGAAAAVVTIAAGGVWSFAVRGAQADQATVTQTDAVESKATPQLAPALDRVPPAEATSPRVPPTSDRGPVAAPSQTPVALETGPAYELTVASFSTPARASAMASDLVASGHPARVAVSDSGKWQMVVVGPYSSQTEADDAKRMLEGMGFSGIKIAQSQ